MLSRKKYITLVLGIVFIQRLCFCQQLFVTTKGYANSNKGSTADKSTSKNGASYKDIKKDKNLSIAYLKTYNKNSFFKISYNIDDTHNKSTSNGFNARNQSSSYYATYDETYNGLSFDLGKQYHIEKLLIRLSIGTAYSLALDTKYFYEFKDFQNDTLINTETEFGNTTPRHIFLLIIA